MADLNELLNALYNEETEDIDDKILDDNLILFENFIRNQETIGVYLTPETIAETWRYTRILLCNCEFSGNLLIMTSIDDFDIRCYIPFFTEFTPGSTAKYCEDNISFDMYIAENLDEAAVIFTDICNPADYAEGDMLLVALSARPETDRSSFFLYTHRDIDEEIGTQHILFEFRNFFQNENFEYLYCGEPREKIAVIPETIKEYYHTYEEFSPEAIFCEFLLSKEMAMDTYVSPSIIHDYGSNEFSRLLLYIFSFLYKTGDNPFDKPVLIPLFTNDGKVVEIITKLFINDEEINDFVATL
ncbi:MAG: hypothetical protein LBM93_06135, partial [Oscillospiraceae bacterium]|nr:hypothetical protein [Oscillospiraceae bacterium]